MEIRRAETVQCIYFSPTGSTKKIVETVAEGTGFRLLPAVDITTPSKRRSWSGQIEGDLLVAGVPVYAGRYPALVVEPFARLIGDGLWAVPIAVCGNVRMGTCLAELCALLRKQGFTIPAAGNFIAQHSFVCDEFPVGRGRPDELDLEIASEFGADVAQRVKDATGAKIEVSKTVVEDKRDYRVDASRARIELGYAPLYTVQDSIGHIKRLLDSGRLRDTGEPQYYNEKCVGRQRGRQ